VRNSGIFGPFFAKCPFDHGGFAECNFSAVPETRPPEIIAAVGGASTYG
jgi:hypothetical protein